MGVNQSRVGTLKNRALINLCLATGNIGRPGAGPLSLTGQPNAMGGRETGGLRTPAARLPQGRPAPRTGPRCAASGTPPGSRPSPACAATELVEALEERRIKVLWIVATNPVVSQPDAGRFAAALRARGPRDLPGRLLPDRDRGARARAAARGAVAGEGRDDDELRAAREPGPARARPARRSAAGLGDLRPRRPRARPSRGVPVAQRGRGARRVRQAHRRPAVRPVRDLAHAPQATVRSSGRARHPSTPARSGSTARAASPRPTAARGSRPRPTRRRRTRSRPTSRSRSPRAGSRSSGTR